MDHGKRERERERERERQEKRGSVKKYKSFLYGHAPYHVSSKHYSSFDMR